MRFVAIATLCAFALVAQKYSGPRPPKPDVPFLLHADNLVETEVSEAQEQQPKKNQILYTVPGAASPAKTPLASPIFLLLAEKLDPGRLQLYKLEPRKDQREILFKKKGDSARPIRLSVERLSADNIYRIEVDESLENGEYSLTPDGSNSVFCFQVY